MKQGLLTVHFMILLIFRVFIALNLAAQDQPDFEVKLIGKAFINKYPGTNMQFYKSWMPGELQMSNGAVAKNRTLVYNCLLDEVIWMRETDHQQVVLRKQTIAGFTLYYSGDNKIAEFRKVILPNDSGITSGGTFLQVLAEGKLSLFVQRKVILLNSGNEFHTSDQYYLLKNGEYLKLVPNRWSLYRLMGEDRLKMKSIVHKNFLFIRKEPALIKAVRLFNQENI